MKWAGDWLQCSVFCTFFCFTVLQSTGEPSIPTAAPVSSQNRTNEVLTSPVTQPTTVETFTDNQNESTASTQIPQTMENLTESSITESAGSLNPEDTSGNVSQQTDSMQTQSNAPITLVTPSVNVTESADNQSNVPQTVSTVHTRNFTINTQNIPTSYDKTPTSTPETLPVYDTKWMEFFQRVHHFDGVYEYEGGRYSFDFVIMYVHPVSIYTLVAKFYDQDGAIIEMNGTSTDGKHIIFKQSNTYSADFRFTALSGLELDGKLVTSPDSEYYTGNITKPFNSSFTWFHMNKGLGNLVTGDAESTRTAIIIVIPASLAFLAVIGTTATLCWASKKGLFGRRHKSYLLFKDNPVSYESEAETIHI